MVSNPQPTTLPIFTESEFQIGDLWITQKQLQKTILKLYPHVAEKSCIFSKFNLLTGKVVKKYAWHSVIGDINRQGLAPFVIESLCDLEELFDGH